VVQVVVSTVVVAVALVVIEHQQALAVAGLPLKLL
jgi:hypothetical protein